MLRNLYYITGWLILISFSFSLGLYYPAQAFAEDGVAAPADSPVEETTEPTPADSAETPQAEADTATGTEKKAEENTAEPATGATAETVKPGEGEVLKPAEDRKRLSPEEAAKLRDSLKIKSRRKQKQTKEKDASDSVIKRIFDASKDKDNERFNIDYSPSKPDPVTADEETPFYKHWIFWTIIGVAAVSGVVIGLKYGLSSNKTMSIDITRREP